MPDRYRIGVDYRVELAVLAAAARLDSGVAR